MMIRSVIPRLVSSVMHGMMRMMTVMPVVGMMNLSHGKAGHHQKDNGG
jgi:hypothetical protein